MIITQIHIKYLKINIGMIKKTYISLLKINTTIKNIYLS
jgi:hypothetical protein